MYKPNNRKLLTVLISVAMIFSAFAILALAVQPAAAVTPTQSFTLTPNTALASYNTNLYVASSSVSFPSGATIYAEWSTTGAWVGTPPLWAHLVAGQTSIVGLIAPTFNFGSGSGPWYLLVSSTQDGTSGTYASEAISVVSSVPSVTTTQANGYVGSTVNVTGSSFPDNTPVNVYFLHNPSTATNFTAAVLMTTATANATGVLATSFTVPTTVYGNYGVIALDTNGTTTVYGYDSSHSWYVPYTVEASVTVSYSSGSYIYAGQSFGVSGTGFAAAGTVAISDNDINGSGYLKTTPSTITVGSDGTFTATVSTMGATFAALSASALATTVSASESGVTPTATSTLNVTGGSITVSPGTISPGGSFTVTGVNFYPGGKIAADSIFVSSGATLTNSAVIVSSTGTFTVSASTLTFTGTLTSNNKQTVIAPETLPSPVTIGGSGIYFATAKINIAGPQITVTYPSGYSLTASENVTVSGTNFFPGATISANSITFAGIAGTNAAYAVTSSGSFSIVFTVPKASALSSTALGVHAIRVVQNMPGGLTYTNTSLSVNAIYSKPTVNNTGIEVALSASASASTSIGQQNVGTTIYYYLFGYPAAQTVSLYMGSVEVVSSIVTDANGAYSGTFAIPALPGSVAGVVYDVQTQSAFGLQAHTYSTVSVSPVITFSATESYFTNYGLLASGDYFNITGTGFDSLATVTITDSAGITSTVASSVTTDVFGSFTAEMQVTSTSLTSNTPVDVTAATSAGATYTITGAFTELGTPTLTLSASIVTTGNKITATVGNAIDTTIAPVSYSVTGPMGAALTGLTYSSDSGTISVTDSTNGTGTEALAANVTGFPGAEAVFLLSIPGSNGYLVNSTGGSSVSATQGGTFTVYAIGFGSGSYVSLGATGSLAPTGGSSSLTTDGGFIFSSVGIPLGSAVGTYLIYGQQAATSGGSPTYTTSLTGSLVVSFSANLTLTPGYTGSIGSTINVAAYGLVADHYYNLYFGTTLLTSSPFLGSAVPASFVVPLVPAGTYNVSIVPVGSTTPAASAGFTVTVTTVFSLSVDAPTAFPGQIVTFSWPVAGTSVFATTGVYGPVTVTVYLNGTAFATVPVSPNVGKSNTWLNGSFQMPNDNVGTYWTLTLSYFQTQNSAGATATASTGVGAYIQLVSGNGALLTGINSSQIATLLTSINSTLKTSMKVPLSELNATVVKLNSTAAEITTAFGNMTATLKAINASVNAIVAGQVIVATDLGTITTSLSSMNATLASISGNLATVVTSLGTVTTSLSNINATVTSNGQQLVTITTDLGTLSGTITSISNEVATINTKVGTMQTNVSQIQGYTSQISNNTKTIGTLEIFLVVIIVLVLITLVLAFMAINSVNKMSRKVSEEKKQ